MEEEEEDELKVSRKPSITSNLKVSDQILDEINCIRSSSGGSSFDSSTKEFMESRFGYDFSKVRIHFNEKAARSANSINSLAYTIGNDIVFAAGQYQPHTTEGKRLIAHELTHVVQRSPCGKHSNSIRHGRNDVIEKYDAKNTSRAASVRQISASMSGSTLVFRQGAAAAPMPVRPPLRPPLRSIPGGRTRRGQERPLRSPEEGIRYAPDPYDNSLEAIIERARRARSLEIARFELERPVATLQRGGSPPNFITDESPQLAMMEAGNVRYTPRRFHVLDAIEYEVSRANTEEQLQQILVNYVQYFPLIRRGRQRLFQVPLFAPNFLVFPRNLDPDGTVRMAAYASAVQRRSAQVGRLAQSQLSPTRVPEETRRRGCIVMPAAPLGDDPLGEIFCQMVTGGSLEYKVTAPDGQSVQYDAMIGNTVYECKCGYARVFDALLRWRETGDGRYRWAEHELSRRTEQMLRQKRVASACGLTLRYYVSNPQFAQLLTEAWHGDPVVLHQRFDECEGAV
jgi:Domain of unknown function (DUF4157)